MGGWVIHSCCLVVSMVVVLHTASIAVVDGIRAVGVSILRRESPISIEAVEEPIFFFPIVEPLVLLLLISRTAPV